MAGVFTPAWHGRLAITMDLRIYAPVGNHEDLLPYFGPSSVVGKRREQFLCSPFGGRPVSDRDAYPASGRRAEGVRYPA